MNISNESQQFHKKVINGVYETDKMLLTINPNSVTKLFKPKRNSHRRYDIEKEALRRLQNVGGTPSLLAYDDNADCIEMSRLPGESKDKLSEQHLKQLSLIVDEMLKAGVARHSMPIRDVVVDEDKVGLVDFERATLKKGRWRIDWFVAKKVSHYHLYRLTFQNQPQLLSFSQAFKVQLGNALRVAFLLLRLKPQKIGKMLAH